MALNEIDRMPTVMVNTVRLAGFKIGETQPLDVSVSLLGRIRVKTHVIVSGRMLRHCDSDGTKWEEEEGQLSTGIPSFPQFPGQPWGEWLDSITPSCSHDV